MKKLATLFSIIFSMFTAEATASLSEPHTMAQLDHQAIFLASQLQTHALKLQLKAGSGPVQML